MRTPDLSCQFCPPTPFLQPHVVLFLLIISKVKCKMVAHIIKFLNSWKIWSVDSCHSKRTPAVVFNLSMMELTVHLCSHFLLEIRLPWTHVLFPFLNYQLRGRTFCFWTKISIRFKSSECKMNWTTGSVSCLY